ncbi:unnamed protein product [Oppiella nova]|uniref:Uncharacterized protein n=1 Tax=Oppiella nova TaxID=334625 RepID=A0A7R9QWB5_9ACAR|nr:unnamed protein product [Oppiella nova]CAG2177973.1 unnamed protein product [Oppiella nova]
MACKPSTKTCQICGDVSTGYHFDAITCESCKSFFRRSALNPDHFRCYLGGTCNIEVKNRKHCKKCRLNKCFAAGMNTELIYSNKNKKSIDTRNGRQKRKPKPEESHVIADSSTLSPPESDTTDTNNLFDFLENIEFDKDMADNKLMPEPDIVGNSTAIELYKSNESVLSVEPICTPTHDYSTTFNEMEGMRLSELMDGIKTLQINFQRSDHQIVVIDTREDAIDLLHREHEYRIRDIIKMSKHLNGFRDLLESDRLILIKYSALEIINLRMILSFNFEEEYWDIYFNNRLNRIGLNVLKPVKSPAHNYHMQFLKNIGLDWDSDSIIIDFLTAILLFDPSRPNLLQWEVVRHQQNIYIHLLQRYLQMKYRSDLLANSKLTRLIDSLKYLNYLCARIAFYASQKALDNVPLFKEICDR